MCEHPFHSVERVTTERVKPRATEPNDRKGEIPSDLGSEKDLREVCVADIVHPSTFEDDENGFLTGEASLHATMSKVSLD
jgi:hypothetical protein